jgi:hypothetical protein
LTVLDRIAKITSSLVNLELLSLVQKYVTMRNHSCISVVICRRKDLMTLSSDRSVRVLTAKAWSQVNEISDVI